MMISTPQILSVMHPGSKPGVDWTVIDGELQGWFLDSPKPTADYIEKCRLPVAKTLAIRRCEQLAREEFAKGHEYNGRRFSLSDHAQRSVNNVRGRKDDEIPPIWLVPTIDDTEVIELNTLGDVRAFTANLEQTVMRIRQVMASRKLDVLQVKSEDEVNALVATWESRVAQEV